MIKCPKCGSASITIEKRPDGWCYCGDCSYSWQRERKELGLTTAEKLLWLWNNVCFERQSVSTMFHTADITKPDLRLYDDDFSSPDGLIAAAYLWEKEQEK